MGNGFAETSVHKIDQKKFEENFNKIDWGLRFKPEHILPIDLGDKDETHVTIITPKLTEEEFHEIYFAHTGFPETFHELFKKYVGK